jgi:23S rRNA (adenine2503-C2)-methyltransferase
MQDLRSLTIAQLQALCTELGWPRYTASQVFTWLWHRGIDDIQGMSNLSKERRSLLGERYTVKRLELLRTIADADGTTKFTFRLADGNAVESVYIPDNDRRTVCVSTQVGCRLGCSFCFTGTLGFTRDLAWHEIAGQVLEVRSLNTHGSSLIAPVTNVVFMGMGEPFLNYEATIEAARTMNSEQGMGIGARRITISTSGIPDGIRAFTRLPQQFRLAVSLNAADDETRSGLMPVGLLHPLAEVVTAVREYAAAKSKRVTFEYVLVDGINNRDTDIRQLAALLRGIPCKVNLIPLNPFPGCSLKAPSEQSLDTFARKLWPLVPAVTIRRSKGSRILAGCGQLAGLTE